MRVRQSFRKDIRRSSRRIQDHVPLNVTRQRPPREKVGAQRVDGKESPHELENVLFAGQVVAKALSYITACDLADRRLLRFKNCESSFFKRVIAPMSAQASRNIAQLAEILALERSKRSISLAQAVGLGRDDQASFEPNTLHELMGATVFESLGNPKGKASNAAHIAISGTPASVSN